MPIKNRVEPTSSAGRAWHDRRRFLACVASGIGLSTVAKTLAPTTSLRAAEPNADSAKPITVCLVSGSVEYKSDESLPRFQEYVEARYPIRCTRAFRKTDDNLPGLEHLDTCDVMLLFTRRLTIDGAQLQRVKDYCDAGRPVVGVRTASHAFQNFLALDQDVLGGNYKGHYPVGPLTRIEVAEGAKQHPILVDFAPYPSTASLYRNTGIAIDTTLLLTGRIPDHQEPLAWTRLHRGGRVFYTSLGAPDDFRVECFQRMLARALLWATGRI